MSSIVKMVIENIKGKEKMEIPFVNFNPNLPNIIVAPNGYGKSTITTAFKCAAHGKIKLDNHDVYGNDVNNHPSLEIQIVGNHEGTYISTDETGGISEKIDIYVINSSLCAYAKPVRIGGHNSISKDLKMNDIVICSKIPNKLEIIYQYNNIKSYYGNNGKLFLNLTECLKDSYNILLLLEHEKDLKKCYEQIRIKNIFEDFLTSLGNGSVKETKSKIPISQLQKMDENNTISKMLECVEKFKNKPSEWNSVDKYFTVIQLSYILKKFYEQKGNDALKKVAQYKEYLELRKIIEARINNFNTTKRTLKPIVDKNQLIIKFERAQSMSNGERDVLSFIIELTKVEKYFKKDVGILVIDEVFDYLDGSNMLAVQFYLSNMLERLKEEGKEIYPIIMTHLDPAVFSNYYFKKYKTHYISFKGSIDLQSDIVKLLKLREEDSLDKSDKELIEKYYLHYNSTQIKLPEELLKRVNDNFDDDNITFRQKMYAEVEDKYLKGQNYNPVLVLAGLRIKIEEYLCHNFPDRILELEEIHKVRAKLDKASEWGLNIDEVYYLLQPLYNDGMHLKGNNYAIENKIKASYLKTNNVHIMRLIGIVFGKKV